MRILYLMTEPFGIGGVQSDLLTLSQDLNERGHEVYLAALPGVLLEEVKAKGARHVEIDFNFQGLGSMMRSIRALREAVQANRIELIAPQSVRSSIIAFLATRLLPFRYRVAGTGRRVPIVTTIHNIHDPRHFRYAGRILQVCADYIIFESHYERNRLLASGLAKGKSTVIHSGIDTDRFVPQAMDQALASRLGLDPTRHFVFGIVARLSEEKGHSYLIEAFASVCGELPNAKLLIVGDGPLRVEVQQQVAELDLEDKVIFAGLQRDIPAFLALMNVFVLSSTRESFPLAAREAMAAGKAVVAPRIGGCPEVVDEGVTGYLFECRNVAELARRLAEVAQGQRWIEFGRSARIRVEGLFSRRAWVDGDEAVYLRWHSKFK